MNPHEILPAPEIEHGPETANGVEYVSEQDASKQVEQSPSSSAGAGALSAAAVGGAQDDVQGAMGQTTAQNGTVSDDATGHHTADDVDLIEKEWVMRAKAIVAATIGDPYTQNKQINLMKTDYIKKRYDKEVKSKDE